MGKQNLNWNQIGNDMKDLVQNAINSQDYSQLNESVSRTVKEAMNQVNKSLQDAAASMAVKNPRPEYFARVNGLRTKSYAQTITGGIFTAGFSVGLLATLIATLAAPAAGGFVGLGVQGALWLGSLLLLRKGVSNLGYLKRFQNYVRIMKSQPYCELEELADKTGKKLNFIKKDIHRMLESGFFIQGHLDEKETCLIVTDEAYKQYQDAQREYRERARKEALIKEKEKVLTPEVQAILKDGQEYLERIHQCNEDIPGEEISNKISRMELLVQRIFEQVRKQPDAAEDLKKMMNYYLPTTVKLLDAYANMDSQPVQGENIITAKREIEDTLDTLNLAFEKLLDEIFKDMAWDVSTDISVLHTLLAQDGLTEKDF